MALDAAGVVLGMNPRARLFLHGLPAQPGRRFQDLFRTAFGDFIDTARREQRVKLQDRTGSTFIASIETLQPTAPASAAGAPSARAGIAGAFVAPGPGGR